MASALTFGNAGTLNGFVSSIVFLAFAIASTMKANPDPNQMVVESYPGLGSRGGHHGGRTPSMAAWNANGELLGQDHKHGHHIGQGQHRAEHIKFPGTNEPPMYLAVVAQHKDAICLSAISMKWPGHDDAHTLLGDVGASCGMPWYHSRTKIDESQEHYPQCVWIGPKSDKRPTDASNQGSGPWSVQNPPAGFSFKIDDMVGPVVNNHTACQRSEENALMSLQIPIFVEKPLIRGPNMMDVDDFLSKPTELSDPLKHHLNPRGADIEAKEQRRAATNLDLLLHGTLVKHHQSAVALCESGTSSGPDFFSHKENKLCHMETKTLVPGCSADVTDDCFDMDKLEIRHKQCPAGVICPRALDIPHLEYKRIDDWSEEV
ncbi:hypothetical protein PMZ80_010818 [Knufia obscura]|uniref:Uncharacterized protein n=1 Tax=Knufia obscura TaxID=1635080 RepID=A0ABR0R8B9_9EURO|nr:hypothetical protein PMZ80_010818 [Knufia obscura]